MITIASLLDLKSLLVTCRGLPTKIDGTGILMAYPPYKGRGLQESMMIASAAEEIAQLRGARPLAVMVNTIPPGIISPIHIDPYPGNRHVERWHLPLAVNYECWLSEGARLFHPVVGSWYGPLKYWEPHQVGNNGLTDRVHLIIDLDKDVSGP